MNIHVIMVTSAIREGQHNSISKSARLANNYWSDNSQTKVYLYLRENLFTVVILPFVLLKKIHLWFKFYLETESTYYEIEVLSM